ncbi:pseudouridine synthase [Agriterribacter sp.]|uniref:pseudouridine synthase n=1 Tax=Agriterribacter sp. TaxID=2821509 RepID=UPI002B5350E4|nr:pseudouridine synthase [Agriterribacter sp.]HRP56405.1 pseudouridine synthase [Agriterribacter sp.]
MSRKPFDKFINKVESGAKKKERIRQEKKKLRAEKNAYFDEQKKLARERRTGGKGQVTGYRGQGAGNRVQDGGSRLQDRGEKAENRGKVTGYRLQVAGEKAGGRGQGAGYRVQGKKAGGEEQKRKDTGKNKELEGRDGGNKKTQIKQQAAGKPQISNPEMPLNKFIAWSGVCGRREAADLIKAGKVTVNNQVIKEPPFRVSQNDSIKVNGKKIAIQKNLVYILLNKPKDYITTTDDPEGRKTVMDLVKRATEERVFPVGRLDRNTTGVLLLTNDGELAQRLTHPKYEVKKIYEVRVDKPVTKQQLDKIANGIMLEDGFIQPDAIAYADSKDKSIVGIEIHSGRNRIVRRIFEHMGFKVKNLDRVMYGIFTKKNVDRGKWRLLTEKEIRLLKHLNTSFANKKSS